MEEQKGMEEEEIIQSRQALMRREDAAGDRSNNFLPAQGRGRRLRRSSSSGAGSSRTLDVA
jgi:hypothetical protein